MSSETDLRRLIESARSDNHLPIVPSHLAEKDGEVIGYASIGLVPMIFTWVHSSKVRARESFALLARVEQEAAARAPCGVICTPCGFASPFHKFMPKLGYTPCGEGSFFLKNLRLAAR